MAANMSLSEESARILLERGLVPVEGGSSRLFCLRWMLRLEKDKVALTVVFFSRRFRVLQRLPYQSGRLLSSFSPPGRFMQRLMCTFGACQFLLSDKHGAHNLGADSGDAVEDQSLSSYRSVRHLSSSVYFFAHSNVGTFRLIKCNFCFFRADDGFEKIFTDPIDKKIIAALLQAYKDRNVSVLIYIIRARRSDLYLLNL